MPAYHVSPEDVESAALSIEAYGTEMQSQADAAYKEVLRLAESWGGVAESAFEEEYQQLHAGVQQATTALLEMAQTLRQIGSNYAEAEAANARASRR